MRFFAYVVLLSWFTGGVLSAQQTYPTDVFRSPVDIPIVLSGTFGEPRSTHFHAGIDIKTQGVINKKIYAIADGWVSRVKVSPYGYGKVLYITHPNGFTSVYAHLNSFDDAIAEWVRGKQYELQQNEIDIDSIQEGLIPVTKGQVIALSGNSGSSGGPHLHFEIRDSLEQAINPLYFGYEVADTRPPNVFNVAVYDMSEGAARAPVKVKKVSKSGSVYTLGNVLEVNKPTVAFGVHTYDRLNGASNKNGVFGIKMYVADSLYYQYEMGRFAFYESRYRHAHMDYTLWRENKQSVHRCHTLPGNQLRCYPETRNNGLVNLEANQLYPIKIEVLDFAGNVSTISFSVRYTPSSSLFDVPTVAQGERFFEHGRSHSFTTDSLQVYLPPNALFESMGFSYAKEERNGPSCLHHIHHENTPLFRPIRIRIPYREKYASDTASLVMVRKSKSGSVRALDSRIEGGFVTAQSKYFGTFYLAQDKTPPVAKTVNFSDGSSVRGLSELRFSMTDNFSGIDAYDVFINGEWVPVYYDYKLTRVTYTVDDALQPGENTIDFVVRDACGNGTALSVTVTK